MRAARLASDERGPGPWLGGLVVLLVAFAYRAVWQRGELVDFESLVFRPDAFPAQVVLLLAGWLLWRRRASFAQQARAAGTARTGPSSLSLLLLAFLLFGWALRVGVIGPLLLSLSLVLLAWAAWTAGPRGCRIVALPAAVLVAAAPIPEPIEDELVWQLQLLTARGAGWLLALIGRDFTQSGVILRGQEHVFHVIDGCSGWNGIGLLLVVAVIVRELFRAAGARMWLLVLLAPPLALVLNVVRVAYVAASPEPEALAGAGGDHTLQGVAIVCVGTAIVYLVGLLLATGRADGRGAASADDRHAPCATARDADAPRPDRVGAAAVAALFAVASLLVSRSPELERSPEPARLRFPETQSGWLSETAPHDPLFTGVFRQRIHRRYRHAGGADRPTQFIDVLIAREPMLAASDSRLFSSKRGQPGPEWEAIATVSVRLWRLAGRAADQTTCTRPTGEYAISYVWSPDSPGPLRRSWSTFWGLAWSSGADEGRTLVRLTAYAPHGGPLMLDRAKQRLDRFVEAFRPALQAL